MRLSRVNLSLCVAVVLMLAQTANAGVMALVPMSDDATSGVSSSKTYTHAFDLYRGGSDPLGGNDALPLSINGVPFAGTGTSAGGTDPVHGGSYTATGINSTYNGHNPGVSGGVGDLLDDFFHNGNGAGGATPGTETVTLSGLAPGTAYRTAFYVGGFGGNLQDITVSDDGVTRLNVPRDGGFSPGARLDYSYIAPAGGQITYTFDAQSNNDSFHQYGFTNEVIDPVVQTFQNTSTGFTVSSVDLLEGLAATVVGNVNPEEGQTTSDVNALTNGAFGDPGLPGGANANEVVAIHNNTTLTYEFDTATYPFGVDVTGIDTYTGWRDGGRDAQDYEVLFSTVDDPGSFELLATVNYNPSGAPSPSDTAVYLTSATGDPLAARVAALQFVFATTENGYVGYREFDVFGTAAVPEPSTLLLAVLGLLGLGVAHAGRRPRRSREALGG